MKALAGLGCVLDSSALLALAYDEPGADRVEPALRRGGLISTVNWAETLSRMAERGEAIDVAEPRLRTRIEQLGTLTIVPYDEIHAVETARLRVPTRSLGLVTGRSRVPRARPNVPAAGTDDRPRLAIAAPIGQN